MCLEAPAQPWSCQVSSWVLLPPLHAGWSCQQPQNRSSAGITASFSEVLTPPGRQAGARARPGVSVSDRAGSTLPAPLPRDCATWQAGTRLPGKASPRGQSKAPGPVPAAVRTSSGVTHPRSIPGGQAPPFREQ